MNPDTYTQRSPGTPHEGGTQDTSGWGFLGLTLGILTGFLASFYLVLPLFPRGDPGTLTITLLTTIVTASMTVCGGVGYLATRRANSVI